MARFDEPIRFNIEKEIAVLGPSGKNWTLELNLVSWNDRPAKIDIRSWSPDHEKMGKGITLSREEGEKLRDALTAYLAE